MEDEDEEGGISKLEELEISGCKLQDLKLDEPTPWMPVHFKIL
jgi:hypothetical protein